MHVIVGTNRPNSSTQKLAQYYQQVLETRGVSSEIITLADLPPDFAFSALYQNAGKHPEFQVYQEKIDGGDKFVFLVPEYNHSFPGALKTFLDGLRYPDTFQGKKVALVGLSAGVLGNAVGLSHLSDILSYMGADVLGLRLKFGQFYQHFDGEKITSPTYQQFLDKQIDQLIAW